MNELIPEHGGGPLRPPLVEDQAGREELRKVGQLKKVPMTSRETSDLIMMGIGAFPPKCGSEPLTRWSTSTFAKTV